MTHVTEYPATHDATNPKAAAKAAKAYAKASRSWYQKKRYWAGIALVVIIGASSASGGTADPSGDNPAPVAASQGKDESKTEAKGEVAEPAAESEPEAEPVDAEPVETVSQENARESAEDYLDMTAFSRSGLIEQLEFEGYSTKDATYGVDSLNADWKAQAAESAQAYLDMTSFSRDGLIEQLVFEGYTREQAEHGVSKTGL
jgi:colicin import membrane protein